MKKRFGGRKAQFTMYVILGIMVLAVVGIGLYFRERSFENNIGEQADKIIAEFLAKGVKSYVEQCLTSVSDEGLKRIGLQGGVLLDSQAGAYVLDQSKKGQDFLYMKTGDENVYVFYGIKDKENPVPPPDYPDLSVQNFKDYYKPYFGKNTLAKLCDKDGPNRIGATSEIAHPCEAGTYNNMDNETTIQKQLSDYIRANMEKCVNLSVYRTAGHNITLEGNISSDVILGYNGVTFVLKYPLTVRVRNSEPVQKTTTFSTFSGVRLMQVYNLAYALVEKEISDIYFDAGKNYTKLSSWAPGMMMMVANNPCTTCINGSYDNVIYIQDSKSMIRGIPYVFQFAVKNRRPALDHITPQMTARIGNLVNINITAIDPDDNIPNITFSGWRQNFTTDPDVCSGDITCLENIDANPSARREIGSEWSWSSIIQDGKLTHRVDPIDLGKHNFAVIVTDEAGLNDWQNLSILVYQGS